MLEALISLRRTRGIGEIGGSIKTGKSVGDIIAAKKSPAVWGKMEKQYFLITYLQDEELEKSLEEVRIYPYAKRDENGEMIERSEYKVNIDMFTGSSGLNPNIITQSPSVPNGKNYLTKSDLILSVPIVKSK